MPLSYMLFGGAIYTGTQSAIIVKSSNASQLNGLGGVADLKKAAPALVVTAASNLPRNSQKDCNYIL